MYVSSEVQKCVAFVGIVDANGNFIKFGTAFYVVHFEDQLKKHGFDYIVTARHVIAEIKRRGVTSVHLRINTHTGFELVETHANSWLEHPEGNRVDACVLPMSFSLKKYDLKWLTTDMAATDEVITKQAFGTGDEVVMTGLFSGHYGRMRNLPIVRLGTIALMRDEPVEVTIGGYTELIDAYLIEARSLGGLSGSPVFVSTGLMRPSHADQEFVKNENKSFYWLGLVHGHWDVSATTDALSEDMTHLPFAERVNMGIAIVVPVQRILEIINIPMLVKHRSYHIRSAILSRRRRRSKFWPHRRHGKLR